MRVEISYTSVGNGFCVYLTRKDIEERVWREVKEIVLQRRFSGGIVLYWSSSDHNKEEEVFEWCESEGSKFIGPVVLGIFDLERGVLEEVWEMMSREEVRRIREMLERDKKFNVLLRELRRIASDEEYAYRLFVDYRGKR